MVSYPRRGDVFDFDFDPTRGSEQGGVRPALVVSNDVANEFGSVVSIVPITRTIPRKQYPQNVHLPPDPLPEPGTIYCGQVLTVSKERLRSYRGRVDDNVLYWVGQALKAHFALS